MAAIDPTAEPTRDGPRRATLKIMRRPTSSMYDDDMDDSDDSDDDSEEDDSKEETPKKKGGKQKDKRNADTMDVDEDARPKKEKKGDVPDDISDDEDGFEEFVICTLDAEKVSFNLC